MNLFKHMPLPQAARGGALALLALVAACASDTSAPVARANDAPSTDVGAEPDLRTTTSSLIDDGTNDALIVAWANATREERHALADAFYERGYGAPDSEFTRVTVTSLDDSGPGTLREALVSAADATEVVFDTDLFRADAPGVIRLQTPISIPSGLPNPDGGPPLTRRVAVIAPAPGAVVVDGDFDDDGTPDTQLFDFGTPGSFYTQPTLVGLELRNATAENGGSALTAGGKAVLIDIWAHSNRVVTAPGLEPFCLSETDSLAAGGAIQFSTPGGVLFRSVISDNTSNCVGGGVVFGRGGALLESVVANNQAAGKGGGIHVWQAAPGVLLFDASTIANNEAGVVGGGVFLTSRFNTFRQTAIVGNEAPLFANTPREINRFDRSFLDVDELPATVQAIGPVGFGEDPRVSALAPQGGPWPTVVPEFCSPLIDEADPADPNPRDLRGLPRPFDLGLPSPAENLHDIGATETQQAFPPCLLEAPVLTGDAEVGGTVTASPVRWRHIYGATPEGTWYRCPADGVVDEENCTPRPDSPLGLTLTLGSGDAGQRIAYAERLDNGVGEDLTFSNALFVPVPPPDVEGELRIVGDVERCGALGFELPVLVDVAEPQVVEIDWFRCFGEDCTRVFGGPTYRLSAADVGATIRVVVRVEFAPGASLEFEATTALAVEDVPPPTCVLSEIVQSPEVLGPLARGTVTVFGACEVDEAYFAFGDDGQPFRQFLSAEESGAFEQEVFLPFFPGDEPDDVEFTCFVEDTGGATSTSDWSYPLPNGCSGPGTCDPLTGRCASVEPDETPCTYVEGGGLQEPPSLVVEPGDDACNLPMCDAGLCVLVVPDCNDANTCTVDSCDSELGCVNAPDVGAACDDGDLCSTGSTCSEAGLCAGGLPVLCGNDDEGPCRTGICNPDDGTCGVVDVADDTPCSDDAACIVDDEGICTEGVCVFDGDGEPCDDLEPLPCEAVVCDPEEGCTLVVVEGGTPCVTEEICEGACEAGLCEGGVPIDCPTDELCRIGRCDLETAECLFEPDPDCELVDEDPADVTEPDVSEPDVAEPDAAEPDVAEPDAAEPDVAEPDVTQPDVAQPDVTQPDVEDPEGEFLAGSGLIECSATSGTRPVSPWFPALVALAWCARPRRRRGSPTGN